MNEQRRGELLINIEACRHMANTYHRIGDRERAMLAAQGFATARNEYLRFEKQASQPGVLVIDPLHGMV